MTHQNSKESEFLNVDPAAVQRTRWALEHSKEFEQWQREHVGAWHNYGFWWNVWQFLKENW